MFKDNGINSKQNNSKQNSSRGAIPPKPMGNNAKQVTPTMNSGTTTTSKRNLSENRRNENLKVAGEQAIRNSSTNR